MPGATGFDDAARALVDDGVGHAEQCIRNIEAAPVEAGFALTDVVRVRDILPDVADFEPCWPVPRRCVGAIRPAATMIEAGLADPRMKMEIEVTGRRSDPP